MPDSLDPAAEPLPDFRQRVLRSLLWQGGGTFATQALTWLTTVLVMRLLSPADYGLMGMAWVFLGMGLLVADLGFGAALIQAPTVDAMSLRRFFGAVLAMAVGLTGITWLGAPLIARFFREPRVTGLLWTLSAVFPLIALYTLPQSLLVRGLEFKLKARIDVITGVISGLASFGLALLDTGVWALVGGTLCLHVGRVIAFTLVRPVVVWPEFTFGRLGEAFRFSGLVTADRLVYHLYSHADLAVAGRMLGGAALGTYSVASTLAYLPLEKVMPTITQVSFAAFSRIQADPDRMRRNVLLAIQLVCMGCLPVSAGLALVAPDAVPLVLGPRWGDAIVPMQLMSLVGPLHALTSVLPPALLSMGRPGVDLSNGVITLLVMVPAFVAGAQWGVVGLSLAWVIAYPLVFAVTSWRALAVLQIPARDFWRATLFPLAAVLLMALGVLVVRVVLGAAPPAVRLAGQIMTGATLYGGLYLVFRRRSLGDLWAMVAIPR